MRYKQKQVEIYNIQIKTVFTQPAFMFARLPKYWETILNLLISNLPLVSRLHFQVLTYNIHSIEKVSHIYVLYIVSYGESI